MKILRQCPHCGRDVVPTRKPGGVPQKFCTPQCRYQWRVALKRTHQTRSQVAEKILGTKAPAVNWTEIQSAWFAALVDGEGTIGIWKEKRLGNSSGYRYRTALEVFNTNLDLINAIASLVDGFAALKRKEGATSRHKTSYRVVVNRRATRSVLERIAPYLVAKRKQADLVIRFCQTVANAPVRGSRVHDVLDYLYHENMKLNKRGNPTHDATQQHDPGGSL